METFSEKEVIESGHEISFITYKGKQKGAFLFGNLIYAECIKDGFFYKLKDFTKSKQQRFKITTKCKSCNYKANQACRERKIIKDLHAKRD